MTATTHDLVEHLMRIVPCHEAELIYLDAKTTSWRSAIGMNYDTLAPLPEGTPLSWAVTGRDCRKDWRTLVPTQPKSAWEELSFLRITTGTRPTVDPFTELDDLQFHEAVQQVAYRT